MPGSTFKSKLAARVVRNGFSLPDLKHDLTAGADLFEWLDGLTDREVRGFARAELLKNDDNWVIFKSTCTVYGRANTPALWAFRFYDDEPNAPETFLLLALPADNELDVPAIAAALSPIGWDKAGWLALCSTDSRQQLVDLKRQFDALDDHEVTDFKDFFSDYDRWTPMFGLTHFGPCAFTSVRSPFHALATVLPDDFNAAKVAVQYSAAEATRQIPAMASVYLYLPASFELTGPPDLTFEGCVLHFQWSDGSVFSQLAFSVEGTISIGGVELIGRVRVDSDGSIELLGSLATGVTSGNLPIPSSDHTSLAAVTAPAGFSLPDVAGMASLTLDVSGGSPRVVAWAFGGELTQLDNLIPLPPALGFEPTVASVQLKKAGDGLPVGVELYAEARILDSFSMAVDVKYPEKQLRAGLKQGDAINIGTVATKLGLSPGTEAKEILDQFEVVDLELGADLEQQELDFAFEVTSTWKAGGHFTLDDIRLFLSYQATTATRSTSEFSFLAEATFSIDDLTFYASLDFEKERDDAGAETSLRLYAATGPGTTLPIGHLITKLASHLGAGSHSVPKVVDSMVITHVSAGIEVGTDNKAFDFDCTGQVDIAGQKLSVTVRVAVGKSEDKWSFTFAGILSVMGRDFEFDLEKDKARLFLLASYYHEEGDKIWLHSLLEPLAEDIARDLPIDPEIILKQAIVALHKGDESQYQFLAGLFMDVPMDFSDFPLVGSMLPAEVGFKDLQLVLASGDFKGEDVAAFNRHLRLSIAAGSQDPAVARGVSLSGNLQLSNSLKFPINLHLGGGRKAPTAQVGGPVYNPAALASPSPAPPSANSQQSVGKTIGPLHFKKVSLAFADQKIGLEVTGGLNLAAFQFEVIGLEVSVPQEVLEDRSAIEEIEFNLDGFVADIHKGTLAIAGGFMHKRYPADPVTNAPAYDEYSGVIQVVFPPFMLSGLGAYANYKGHPSLFLFVALGFPLTVHPSLIITGMALGFGVHRDFIPPKVDEILTYPLVAVSVTPPPPIDLEDMVEKMHRYFPAMSGQFFVVAGVKFRAIGIVNNLTMLAVKFGRKFEIDLIGVSSVFLAATFVELGWLVRFVPAEGYLFMGGALTNRSYLLVPMAHLTGGFAVAIWMIDQPPRRIGAGDFVITLGGYHPKYPVPAHYPNHVARLGISFQLGSLLTIKGGAYMAVTPKAIMMGGALEATLHLGPLEGWLRLAMNFIIWFQPFHYDALIAMDAGVKVDIPAVFFTIHINIHLHADMHVWGPKFAGTAHLDLHVKTFKVAFGEAGSKTAKPIGWSDFKTKFLPSGQACGVTVASGMIRKVKMPSATGTATDEVVVVNPKELELDASSVMPFTTAADTTTGAGGYKPGITPMGVTSYTAVFSTELTYQDGTAVEVNREITRSSVPTAIWGNEGLVTESVPSPEGSLAAGALTGVTLTPAADLETGVSHEIDKRKFAYNTDRLNTGGRYGTTRYKALNRKLGAQKLQPESAFTEFTGLESKPAAVSPQGLLDTPEIVTLDAA